MDRLPQDDRLNTRSRRKEASRWHPVGCCLESGHETDSVDWKDANEPGPPNKRVIRVETSKDDDDEGTSPKVSANNGDAKIFSSGSPNLGGPFERVDDDIMNDDGGEGGGVGGFITAHHDTQLSSAERIGDSEGKMAMLQENVS